MLTNKERTDIYNSILNERREVNRMRMELNKIEIQNLLQEKVREERDRKINEI